MTIASDTSLQANPADIARDSRRSPFRPAVVGMAVCQLAGVAAIVRGYQIGATTLTGTAEFAWFWAGMLLIELPLAAVIGRRATPRAARLALLTLYGLVSFAPKLLRSPTSPVYYDEFTHWREAWEILATGRLFQPNPINPIIAKYPGLHAATATLVSASGLTIWQAALFLLLLLHVALVLGIAALAEALGLDNRTAALAALIYGLNSSFLYFDTQYSYESMAITLAVWALAGYARAIRARHRHERLAWAALTVVLSAGTVITHHLSSMMLVLVMGLAALALSIPWLARGQGWIRTAVTAWSLALTAAGMLGAWMVLVAPGTWAYLSPYFDGGIAELVQFIRGSGGSRALFTASLSPWWERNSAYLVTVMALCAAVGGLALIRARIRDARLPSGPRRALLAALAAWGLVYFPSTVFILFPFSAEGARRTWAFTWIGLGLLAAPAAVWLVDWAGRRTHRWQRAGTRAGLAGLLAVALVGGTAAGLDAEYRFPGPFLYGSDARSVTPELLAVGRWFSDRFGAGNNIVTDRDTGFIFGSFGLQNPAQPSSGFPVWDLYSAAPGAPITPSNLLPELSGSDYLYLIVDERMATQQPEIGIYFETSEPASIDALYGGKPIFYGRLGKFSTMSWLVKVFQSDNYSIYRFDLPASAAGYDQSRLPTSRGQLTVTP